VQPMLDARLDVGDHGVAEGHFLVDAITSASVGSGADDTAFSEQRYEVGGGYTHELGGYRLGGQARLSSEPDYRSLYAGARFEADLRQRNLTVAVGGGIGDDRLSNAGAPPMVPRIEGTLRTYLVSASVAQVLDRNAVASLTYDLALLDGVQHNLYRTVIAAGTLVPERHPTERHRHAVAGSVRWFVPRTATTVIGSYRYYRDDWGVQAHTPELRVIQDAGDSVWFGVRYRYHHQRKADFYQTMYQTTDPAVEPWLSDDIKLSAFDSQVLGARFGVYGNAFGLHGRWGATRGEVVIEYVAQDNRFGNAGIAHAALTVPLDSNP